MATDIALDLPATAEPETRARTRRLPLIIGAILVIALATWGVRRYLYGRNHVSTDNAQVDGHITSIAPRISGFIDQVPVEENQHVKLGDTLVVLDRRDLAVRLQQAEAELRTAEASAGSSRKAGEAGAQLQASRAEAASTQAAVTSAEAAYRQAVADYERYRGLAASKIIPAQQLDAVLTARDQAAANLEAARRRAAAGTSQVSAQGAALRGADAKLAAAQAAVENARLQLSYATLLAPSAGIVAKRTAEPGGQVQIGQNLMSIVPDTNIWITANMKETQLAKIRVGDPAEFDVDAYPGRTFHGKVESLSPATGARFALLPPDNATGNFTKVVQRVPIRIAVDDTTDPEHPLRPGMSVDVTVTTN